jgi:hypothetical protein
MDNAKEELKPIRESVGDWDLHILYDSGIPITKPNPKEELIQRVNNAWQYASKHVMPRASWYTREFLRVNGYRVPDDSVSIPDLEFRVKRLYGGLTEKDGKKVFDGHAMEISPGIGKYRVDVHEDLAHAPDEQILYKVIHEALHGVFSEYGMPIPHDLSVEQFIDHLAAEAMGRKDLKKTSQYIGDMA